MEPPRRKVPFPTFHTLYKVIAEGKPGSLESLTRHYELDFHRGDHKGLRDRLAHGFEGFHIKVHLYTNALIDCVLESFLIVYCDFVSLRVNIFEFLMAPVLLSCAMQYIKIVQICVRDSREEPIVTTGPTDCIEAFYILNR